MMKNIVRFHVFVVSLIFLSLSAVNAEEEQKALPWERFSLGVGGMVTTMNTSLRLGSEAVGAGTYIDLEDSLGLDSSITVIRADAMARFTRNLRHRFEFSFTDYRRKATRDLTEEIEIGGDKYPVGTKVDSTLAFEIIRGSYTYSLFLDDRVDLGLSLGAYVLPVLVKLDTSSDSMHEEKSITAPLPTLGVRFDFAITPKLFFRDHVDVFRLRYETFQGNMVDLNCALEYYIWKHFGVGLAYEFFGIQLQNERTDYPTLELTGALELNYSGLLLYGKVIF
jgi:hypothetical protein